ncbi:MAG: DUF2339 domain-containing protein [Pseudomonadota bacterium]
MELLLFVLSLSALGLSGSALYRVKQTEKRVDRLVAAVMERRQTGETEPVSDGVDERTQAAPTKDAEDEPTENTPEGDEPPAVAEVLAPAQPAPPAEPTAFDLWLKRAEKNLSEYWVFWLSGLSLAMGGIFLMRYGIEAGYFGPPARVVAAIVFGLGLIGTAEWLRQKLLGQMGWYDLPPTLAGAGLFSLFGAIVGAHLLYDLFSVEVTFAALAAVAFIAVGGGILYGPMLSVLGVLGAYAAPFLLNSDDASPVLLLYFAVVFAASLGTERYMQWAWLSALSAICAYLAGFAVGLSAGYSFEVHLYAMAISVLAIALPAYGVWASPQAHIPLRKLFDEMSVTYPIVFAVIVSAVFLGAALPFEFGDQTEHLLVVGAAIAIVAWLTFVMHRAEPLKWVTLVAVAYAYGALFYSDPDLRLGDAPIGQAVAMAVALGATVLLGSVLRARTTRFPRLWFWIGALIPVGSLSWISARDLNRSSENYFATDVQWGLVAFALAGLLGAIGWLTLRDRVRDTRRGLDAYVFGSALSAALGVTLFFESEFFAHAFAAIAIVTTVLIARFRLRVSRNIVWAGLAVSLSFLIFENGWDVERAADSIAASVFDPVFVNVIYLAAVGFYVFGWRLALREKLLREVLQFETAALVGLAVYGVVWVDILLGSISSAWFVQLALNGTISLILAWAAFYRLTGASQLVNVRYCLAFLYGAIGSVLVLLAVSLSPFVNGGAANGIFPFDAITLSFLLPALVLLAISRLETWRHLLSQWFLLGPSIALLALIVVSQVRRFWHGPQIGFERGTEQGELYTYSVMMLVATGIMVWFTLSRQNLVLKRYTLFLAALTAAKVFLIDSSGMTGLPRATIFMVLGAALGGIAWLLNSLKPSDTEASPRG